ncbi:hypothetical protein D3C84_1084430 [compost metagenome]
MLKLCTLSVPSTELPPITLPVVAPLSSAIVTASLASLKPSVSGVTLMVRVESSVLVPSVRV